MRPARRSSPREAGFTLLEVLAGLVLASLILVSLNMAMSAVGKGSDRTRAMLGEQSELDAALDVFGRDVARIAKFRRPAPPRGFEGYLFDGRADRVIYPLREQEGLSAPGLYLVRLSLREQDGQRQLLRERARLKLGAAASLDADWGDPVVLLSGNYDVAFAYRAQRTGAREWSDSWPGAEAMPEQIRLTITDRATNKLRVPGLVYSLAIDTEPDCVSERDPRCGPVETPGQSLGARQ